MNNFVFLFLSGVILLTCCTTKPEAENAEWAELESFHEIMSETYHPVRDSSNVLPAMQHAGEMARQAESWADADLPDRIDNDDIRETLRKLKYETAALSEMAKAGDTLEVGQQMEVIHDLFHHLREGWYLRGEGEEDHHEEEHH